MRFGEFASYLKKLEKTSSRIEITKILARLFGEADGDEVDKIVYLSLGELAPSFRGLILNLAEKTMIRVIAYAYGQDSQMVKKLYKEKGDLGTVAEALAPSTIHNSPLTVSDVYKKLVIIANDSGEGSQERKIKKMAELLKSVDELSARFITRIPIGKLRLGFSDKTILDALSWMEVGDKSAKKPLEAAYQVLPDPGKLAWKVKQKGINNATSSIKPVVGTPILPMLAQRLKSPKDMLEKMGKVGVEPKFDGLRLQIHLSKEFVKAFTRNLNETSWMFPELKDVAKYIKAKSAILDCEAVGLDEETKKMANFQTTMTRRRKHKIEATSKKIGIEFFIFDILEADSTNYMGIVYTKRKEILRRILKSGGVFKFVDYKLTNNADEIDKLYKDNIKKGLEGIIAKKADAKYVPGRTGWHWVKMKHEENAKSKLADTIDAVIVGYSRGRGKRAVFGVGQFLVGVKSGTRIKTISKVGTGLTDEQFKKLAKRLESIRTGKKPKEYDVHKNYTPDFWVEPSLVVEIAADEITRSPTHTSGFALRFPRLIRFRDDKNPSQATTLKEFQNLFRLQKG